MIYTKEKTKSISFPLGGIGTGCIGLAGNGELNDWEIFNRPNKNTRNGYSHFAIRATANGKTIARVLHGDTFECLTGTPGDNFGFGPRKSSLAGFPHFEDYTFIGTFPIANLSFFAEDFPAKITLTAFNPFIPHDEFNSSLPAAFFEWNIENTADTTVNFALAGTVCNPNTSTVNRAVEKNGYNGVFFDSGSLTPNDAGYSDLCILTDGVDTDVQEYWYRGISSDDVTMYWNNLITLERMPKRHYEDFGKADHGSVLAHVTLRAGDSARVRFVIAWNAPIFTNYWKKTDSDSEKRALTWKNYYATQFENSFSTASYALEHFGELYKKTKAFSDAIQTSTLSESVKDAISANLSTIKTPVALRLEDGSFWGWEGLGEQVGSCEGTCQHVWNYAYVLPYLFPRLERSIREMVMDYSRLENGATEFRINLPLKKLEKLEFHSCVDGQMGEVIKCYREWLFSGDGEWIKRHADKIFSMLEYAWSPENPDRWDADMDGVLEGRQHHTLDREIFGPSSWLQGFYLLALDCGRKIAAFVGDKRREALYAELYDSGRTFTNENLFNGEYFYHKVNLNDKELVDSFGVAYKYFNEETGEIKQQIGEGCIIDQMLSDWHAHLIGSNAIFDTDKKRKALESLYKYNFKHSMRSVINKWRNFTLNDEAGTLICTYPEGRRSPVIPIPYCEETMTGFEYALAGLMIAEGLISEGEELIRAIRARYDGERRNPWNEIECGSNYARAMAAFALLPIYAGFSFDMTRGHIGFEPKATCGKYLFSVSDSYGVVEFEESEYRISMLGNPLTLSSIKVNLKSVESVTIDGARVAFALSGGEIKLNSAKITKEIVIR